MCLLEKDSKLFFDQYAFWYANLSQLICCVSAVATSAVVEMKTENKKESSGKELPGIFWKTQPYFLFIPQETN